MKTALKNPKPPSAPASRVPASSDRHYDLFKASLTGLLAGAKFHHTSIDGRALAMDSQDELRLLKKLTFLAWNSASYACEMFAEEDETLQAFSKKV